MATSTEFLSLATEIGPSMIFIGIMVGTGIVMSFVAWSFISETVSYIFLHFRPHDYYEKEN